MGYYAMVLVQCVLVGPDVTRMSIFPFMIPMKGICAEANVTSRLEFDIASSDFSSRDVIRYIICTSKPTTIGIIKWSPIRLDVLS